MRNSIFSFLVSLLFLFALGFQETKPEEINKEKAPPPEFIVMADAYQANLPKQEYPNSKARLSTLNGRENVEVQRFLLANNTAATGRQKRPRQNIN